MAKQSHSGRVVGSGRVVARGLLDPPDPDEMGLLPVRVRKRAIPVDVYDSSDSSEGLLYNELESMRNKLTRAKNSLIRANHEVSVLKGLVDRTTEGAASVQRENGELRVRLEQAEKRAAEERKGRLRAEQIAQWTVERVQQGIY